MFHAASFHVASFHAVASWLFASSTLAARGAGLQWQPALVWLDAVSNVLAALAFMAIPLALAAIRRQRPDLLGRPVFALIAAFALLCGVAHLMNLITLWVPAYGSQAILMAAAAALAVLTAAMLWRLLPRVLALPSRAQLRRVHQDLHALQLAETRMATIAADASGARDALARELARRVMAEKEVQESAEQFGLLLQSTLIEALYLLGPDGTIETWNVAAERIKGYTAAEIIGRSFATFFTPEDQAEGLPAALLARARDGGRFSTEGWRVRKDGVRFRARVSIDAIRRPDGTLRGYAHVTQDITDRRIEEEQRAIIIEAAPVGMIIADERGIITLANARAGRMLGRRPAELAGQTLDALIPPDQTAAHELLRTARAHGLADQAAQVHQVVVAHTGADATPSLATPELASLELASLELMLNTVATPRGHIVVAALLDATERVREAADREAAACYERAAAAAANAALDRLLRHVGRARDRAEEASRAKSRFLASITHELRTPLHGVLGYAELLTLEGGLSATQSERLETMMAAGQHLLGMVNAVFDMSQIESNRLELQPADIDLSGLIALCLKIVRPAAEARGLALGTAPQAARHVLADPTRLRQVLINLLGNAVKFTASGHIDVRVSGATGWDGVRIEVADTGPGIAAARAGLLFSNSDRGGVAAAGSGEGAGLGLAISAHLIEAMQGRIGYSDNRNGGSIFWLELPAAPAAPALGVDAAAPAAPDIVDEPPLRVLVADDEMLNRSIASHFLSRAGHRVVCVETGAAAVAAAAAQDFDVILMDVRMPGMNGMEAARAIRGLPGARGRARIVAVTAQAFSEQIDLCRLAGMDAHLSKPFKQATLLAVLRGEGGRPPAGQRAAPAADAPPAVPLLDHKIFRETIEFLPPADMADHVRTLEARCAALLRLLRVPGALTGNTKKLVDTTHALVGAAGMFGLTAVCVAARACERAFMSDAPAAAKCAEHLASVLAATIDVLRNELEEVR